MKQTNLKIDLPSGSDKIVTERLASQEILEGTAGAPSHAVDHITGGSDEIDGDKLDIDWSPSNYTPSTSPSEADDLDNLTAHLYGIDQALSTPATHAPSHITGGSDEIDGDQLDIDYTPSGYSPTTSPSQATDLDHLTAHLAGISDELLDKIDENGTVPLTGNWDVGSGNAIESDIFRARDATGMGLYDQSGDGIFVEDGGQVGVGTTSPSSLLHLQDDNPALRLVDTTDSRPAIISMISSVLELWSSGSGAALGDIVFRTGSGSGTVRVTIKGSGNVGIASTSPGSLLDVGESGGTDGEIRVVSSGGRILVIETDDSGNFAHIGTESNHGLQIVTNDTEQLSVDTSGKLSTKDVDTTGDLAVKNGSTEVVKLFNTNNIATGPDILIDTNAVIAIEGTLYLNIDSDNGSTDAALIIGKDADTSSATELMRVQENGRVGIGTSSPLTILSNTSTAPTSGTIAGNAITWGLNESGFAAAIANTGGSVMRLETDGATRYQMLCYEQDSAKFGLVAQGNRAGVGNSSPSAKLHVDQDGTAEAIPALRLDQDDLSEEFIRFQTTVGDSNPASTKMVGSHYGRVRVNVNGTDKWMPVFNDDTDSDWTGVTFNSGWQNDAGFQAVEYRLLGDIVYMRGRCERVSGSNATVFTLPSGFRPPANLSFLVLGQLSGAGGPGAERLNIDTGGNVSVVGTVTNSQNFFHFDQLFFSTTS